jgi:hypothetical protein
VTFETVMWSFLQQFLMLVVSVLFSALVAFAIGWMRSKSKVLDDQLKRSQYAFVYQTILSLVKAAEQMGTWDELLKEAKQKRDWVLFQAQDILNKQGIKINLVEIIALMEEIVRDELDHSAVPATTGATA